MAHSSKLTASFQIKRLGTIYILYWFLLTYIIVFFTYWFILLNQLNKKMTDYKLSELNPAHQNYQAHVNKITDEKNRKTGQYIGEGVTFFLLIVIGAVAVFRAVRRQFIQSRQQQNFMMAITHELKTPIAIAKLNLETLQKHKLSEEQQQHLISNTLQEAGRLNSLCNNLLLASKIEAGDYRLTTEKIELAELVTESINDFAMRFPKRNITVNAQDNIFLTGDRLMLQMAVNNLLDNAIKYSGKEDKIEVEVKKENDGIKILVKDEGKGIPGEEKAHIFNKFYRMGNLHAKEAKGTGLGLYLTKKIVEQHNGKITVTGNNPRGSIFEIKL
ncbi:MAG TPA: ATP-binding protein [Chitinophagaceae bacterium]|nr:ATP-binding protein [Chitinophagaceae bacterium]